MSLARILDHRGGQGREAALRTHGGPCAREGRANRGAVAEPIGVGRYCGFSKTDSTNQGGRG